MPAPPDEWADIDESTLTKEQMYTMSQKYFKRKKIQGYEQYFPAASLYGPGSVTFNPGPEFSFPIFESTSSELSSLGPPVPPTVVALLEEKKQEKEKKRREKEEKEEREEEKERMRKETVARATLAASAALTTSAVAASAVGASSDYHSILPRQTDRPEEGGEFVLLEICDGCGGKIYKGIVGCECTA